jgi:pimeloyl-ACP methyl ester carboxylesterase
MADDRPTHSLAAHSRRARVAGVDTHWLEAGAGPAVLLLHGLGASSYSFRHVFTPLARRFRVIAPDWPGFGRSEAPLSHDYSLLGQARWLTAFLDQSGVDKARLAGNSMGGVISLVAAMDFPERVDRVCLLGAPTYPGNRPKLIWPIGWPVVGRLYEALLGPTAVRLIGRTAFKDPAVLTEEAVAEYSISLSSAAGRRATAEFVRRAVPPDAAARVARYPTIRQPILFICGDSDGVVPLESARRFAREAPRVTLLELEACGHAAQEEKPEIVSRALEEFFA